MRTEFASGVKWRRATQRAAISHLKGAKGLAPLVRLITCALACPQSIAGLTPFLSEEDFRDLAGLEVASNAG